MSQPSLLNNFLRNLRLKKHGLEPLENVAREMGLSKSYISKIETGAQANLNWEAVQKYREHYSLSKEWFRFFESLKKFIDTKKFQADPATEVYSELTSELEGIECTYYLLGSPMVRPKPTFERMKSNILYAFDLQQVDSKFKINYLVESAELYPGCVTCFVAERPSLPPSIAQYTRVRVYSTLLVLAQNEYSSFISADQQLVLQTFNAIETLWNKAEAVTPEWAEKVKPMIRVEEISDRTTSQLRDLSQSSVIKARDNR